VPLATLSWGVVVFESIENHVIDEAVDSTLYPHARDSTGRLVWAQWRMPTLQEIYRARPARELEDRAVRESRGWWHPTREELQERARKLRQVERAAQSRHALQKNSAGF